jgi:hypothetical protein
MPLITVENTNSEYRYDFSGSALPTDWNIVAQGTNQTVSVASSVMTIASGTDINQQTIVRCTRAFRTKMLVRFVVALSQRIVNQNIYLEVTNAAGTTFARYDLNGATATNAQVQTSNQGTANTAATVTIPTTASYVSLDISIDPNDVMFSSVASNTNSLKSGAAVFDRLIPDPAEDYYVQVRVLNGGTAPASSTSVNVDAVVIQDANGVLVDLVRASGSSASTATLPVQVVSSAQVTVTPAASLALGTSTFHHAISAATTNATVVKASVGVISDIVVSNNAASPRYFKLYSKATAPTVGTDTPLKTILIPANSTVAISFAPFGLRVTTGIGYALTTGITVADVAAVGANEMAVNISYA